MGQQHRVRSKRKRRKAYLKRKRTTRLGSRPAAAKAKPKKQATTKD